MKKLICTALALAIALSCFVSASAKTADGFDYGDVNSDNAVNSADALVLAKYLAMIDVDALKLSAADTNADGKIGVADLLMLKMYLADNSVILGPEVTARIELSDSVSAVTEGDGENVAFSSVSGERVITLSGNGTYWLSGKMNGRIIVKYPSKADEDKITIVLNGVELTSSVDSPLWVDKAEKTIITTVQSTTNTITDLSTEGNSACIYADDDMTVNGGGKLFINTATKNGIKCENDLKISDGTLEINSGKNGIVGETSVTYKDAVTKIYCQNDAIKTTDEEKTDKGFIEMSSGTVYASSGDDVLQATRRITVSGGKIYYKFTAVDPSSCHKTNVGTKDALGNTVIEGTQSIADGVFSEWLD